MHWRVIILSFCLFNSVHFKSIKFMNFKGEILKTHLQLNWTQQGRQQFEIQFVCSISPKILQIYHSIILSFYNLYNHRIVHKNEFVSLVYS